MGIWDPPNRSKGIITAWSPKRPGGNETETAINKKVVGKVYSQSVIGKQIYHVITPVK
jgi:hypothetical protein